MNLKWKILLGIVAALFIASSVFGWHIHTVYRQFTASTNIGPALFDDETLGNYGKTITAELRKNNVKAAIVSRSGQPRDKLPKGVMFTHSAFFLYQPETENYAVYNLYHGEENRLVSSLVADTPADFLRLLRERDAGFIIPDDATQEQLYNYILSPQYGAVHQVNYSLISNPYDPRLQNCNEFMLDTLAAMIWNTTDSLAIKARLKDILRPAELKTSLIRRYIGPLVDERLVMEDHEDKILTTTSKTLANFLEDENRLKAYYMLDLETGAQQAL
ncbi:DUF2145 domain-containing protein [Hellea sp.]|nr:DUF2145 domain-containing protein [Hellea sp.]